MRSDFADAVPSHCEELVSCLARHYAETWMRVARELEKRAAAQGKEQEQETGFSAL
ncbi:hypothetical protein QQY66_00250 [Streptomyces sp. DG2A-72]|uniref:hypothetical protein n=1 Tax=Streptomyces sp. DG2A-72 TaxID=3051386 RepID=UPI00265BF983|nr:hypothetical protein [Streptomyces sp. DG2A-72]MDO0930223.1 hypothetical protein [Streptomyces sp. DG2A-72]